MEKDELISIADRAGGNEYDWIDFKSKEYYLNGPKRQEFIKDVSSFANSRTEGCPWKDSSVRFLCIGFENDGNVCGIDCDTPYSPSESKPNRFVHLDSSDIHSLIRSSLAPSPDITVHQFFAEEPYCGAIEIGPPPSVPSIVSTEYNWNDMEVLKKGHIYYREGDESFRAGPAEIEDMITRRIQAEQKEMLDDVRKAITLGPEMINKLASISDASGSAPVNMELPADFNSDAEESMPLNIEVGTGPLNPIQKLNADVSTWQEDEVIPQLSKLYFYYSKARDLDEESSLGQPAIEMLSRTATCNWIPPCSWLYRLPTEQKENILEKLFEDFSNHHSGSNSLYRLLTAYNDATRLRNLAQECETGNIGRKGTDEITEPCGLSDSERYRAISRNTDSIRTDDYSLDISYDTLSIEECLIELENLGCMISSIESKPKTRRSEEEQELRTNLKAAIVNLEVIIGCKDNSES